MEQSGATQSPSIRKLVSPKWRTITICLIFVMAVESIFVFTFYLENQTLEKDYNSLSWQYSNLQSSYTNLQDSYTNLQGNYSRLDTNYRNLQSEYNAYVSAYLNIRHQINLHSTHPTEDEKQLVTPTDSSVVNVTLQVTGGWSNTSDWNEYWDDQKKLYEWVINNIRYASDPLYPSLPEKPLWSLSWSEDNWQYPNETLRTKQGDCEDQALLLTSLILAYTSQSHEAYCIVITGHASTFIPVSGDKICILDPVGRYTTNSGQPTYDLDPKDIRKEVYNWLNYIGDHRQVYRVFDNTYWKVFFGTEDFITWLYNFF